MTGLSKINLLWFLMLSGICHAQTISDTVFVKRHISEKSFQIDTMLLNPGGVSYPQVLVGTTMLPYSDKMINLINHGIRGVSLENLGGCSQIEDVPDYSSFPKIINVERDSAILTVDVMVISNCCNNFLGEAEVIGEDTLNLVFTTYGGFCSCDCCYTLRYRFNTFMEREYSILQWVMVHGARKSGFRIPDYTQ